MGQSPFGSMRNDKAGEPLVLPEVPPIRRFEVEYEVFVEEEKDQLGFAYRTVEIDAHVAEIIGEGAILRFLRFYLDVTGTPTHQTVWCRRGWTGYRELDSAATQEPSMIQNPSGLPNPGTADAPGVPH